MRRWSLYSFGRGTFEIADPENSEMDIQESIIIRSGSFDVALFLIGRELGLES
jgi:hypothetical protein